MKPFIKLTDHKYLYKLALTDCPVQHLGKHDHFIAELDKINIIDIAEH